MNTPSARVKKITALSTGPVAILLAGALVWQGSQAAFTATTRNAGNSWGTGQVVLTDDDEGRAGFTVENMVPGQSGENCLVVTSQSNVAGEVRAYMENLSGSAQGLEEHIDFNVQKGTGGSFGDCTGFEVTADAVPAQSLAWLAANNNNWENGGAAWQTTGEPGESVTYRGTWTFDTAGMTQQEIDALQGAKVSADLVWELRTTEGTSPTP